MRKFISIPFISSAKREENKSHKLLTKVKHSIKLYSILQSKIKFLLSQIKVLKIGSCKKILHLSLTNLLKNTNFKIFTLIQITNHSRSALRQITFYVGKNLKNAQSITSLQNKSNVFWRSTKLKYVSFWKQQPVENKKTNIMLKSITKWKFMIWRKIVKLPKKQFWNFNTKLISHQPLWAIMIQLDSFFWSKFKGNKTRLKSTFLDGAHSLKIKRKKLKREKLLEQVILTKSNCILSIEL